MEDKHSVMEKSFQYNVCDKLFFSENVLYCHVQRVHSETRLFQCENCGASFKERGKLKRHFATVHEKSLTVVCHVCGKTYSCKDALIFHNQRMHDTDSNREKPQCSICNKCFSGNVLLGLYPTKRCDREFIKP